MGFALHEIMDRSREYMEARSMDESETYTVDAECNNCDFRGEVTLAKGVPFGSLYEANNPVCPNCGCQNLVRTAVIRGPLPRRRGLPWVIGPSDRRDRRDRAVLK